MMEASLVEELARRHQTSRDNIAREYCQHLFLSNLYQQEGSEKILFKGGTALRILWNSPRFSEDLDFSGFSVLVKEIEDRIQETLAGIEREGLRVDIQESKKTSGGYLGKIFFKWENFLVPIQMEISLRKGSKKINPEQTLVSSDLIPPYTVLHLPEAEIIREKMNALLERSKPRDYFDLYFLLRNHRSLTSLFQKKKDLKKRILEGLRKQDTSRELKQFLPASHQVLLKNFPSVLERELNRVIIG